MATLYEVFTNIANAIRSRTGKTDAMTPDEMGTEILTMELTGGVELPELTNPATSEEIFLDKETIDANGNVQTGTFTIDGELTTQNDLIAQIQSAVDNLPDAGGGGNGSYETCTVNISSFGGTFGNEAGTIVYNTLENGTLKVQRIDGITDNLSIQAVCGSFLLVNETGSRIEHSFVGLKLISSEEYSFFGSDHFWCFQVTTAANESATLTIEID